MHLLPELLRGVIVFDQASLLRFKVDDTIRAKARSLDLIGYPPGMILRRVLALEERVLPFAKGVNRRHVVLSCCRVEYSVL